MSPGSWSAASKQASRVQGRWLLTFVAARNPRKGALVMAGRAGDYFLEPNSTPL